LEASDVHQPDTVFSHHNVIWTHPNTLGGQDFIPGTTDTVRINGDRAVISSFKDAANLDVCKNGGSVLDLR
jgi:hypothetical protein